jgi:hypothetical protein
MQQDRRQRDPPKKRGRKVDVFSKRQQSLEHFNNKRMKRHQDFTNATKNIDYWNNHRCCGQSCYYDYDEGEYPTGLLVTAVRKYCLGLRTLDLRQFCLERGDEYMTSFRLEKPKVLLKRLLLLEDSKRKHLPRPTLVFAAAETRPVCQKFFLWLICKTEKYFNGHRRVGAIKTPFVLDPQKLYKTRSCPKTDAVLDWCEMASEMYTVLPNSDKTVLPFPNWGVAHASFVLGQEAVLGDGAYSASSYELMLANMRSGLQSQIIPPEQADEGKQDAGAPQPERADEGKHDAGGPQPERADGRPYRSSGVLSGDDEDEEQGDGFNPAAGAAPGLAQRALIYGNAAPGVRLVPAYRYGNPLLGLKSQLPEVPGIAYYPWFCAVRRDPFRKWLKCLITRKYLPFAKCDDCTEFRAKMEESKDKQEKATLTFDYKKHIYFVMRERKAYYTHMALAVRHPSEYLSLIVDGADQSDHGLPHFHTRSHKTEAAWKMKLHLMGVIAHGRGSFLFTVPSHAAQGHNVTMQSIWRTIILIKQREGRLPPKLYVQLDNTTKQCKGKYIMAFLALLVHHNVFKEIIVGHLPVGHTHEDIDQLFSRLAVYLRFNDALSREAMAECCRRAYIGKDGTVPHVEHWETVGNLSGWFKGKLNKIRKVTKYHQFRLQRSAQKPDEIWLQAREWPGDDATKPWSFEFDMQRYVKIFKTAVPDMLADYDNIPSMMRPQGQTDKTVDEMEKEATKIGNGIATLQRAYPAFTGAHVDDCLHLLKLWQTPLDACIPFDWDREEMKDLLENPPPPEGEAEVEEPLPAIDLRLNQVYLYKPSDEEKKDYAAPFFLAKIKKKEGGSVRVQFWEVDPDPDLQQVLSDGGTDYIQSWWGAGEAYKDGVSIKQLPLYPQNDERFIMAVRMVKRGKATYPARMNACDKPKVAYWMEIWKGGADHDVAAEDIFD